MRTSKPIRAVHQRAYLPPNQRKRFKGFVFPFSVSSLSLLLVFSLALYSLFSPFTAFFNRPKKVEASSVTRRAIGRTTIVDQIRFSENKGEVKVTNSSVNLANVDLSQFPLERNWPLAGRLTTYYSSSHPAIDIAASWGTPVHPYASGIVLLVGSSGSFGNHITIVHANGIETVYAHLSRIAVVAGQEVDPTTVIGAVGATGLATGPHLHFQVSKNGRTTNPLAVLP